MTTHVHGSGPALTRSLKRLTRRQRWALVGIPLVLVAGALVLTGVMSASTVLFAAVFGGMMLMHLGGHGSHGGHGDSHAGRAPGTTTDPRLDAPAQAQGPGDEAGTLPSHGTEETRTGAAPASTPERDSRSCH